MSFILTPFEQYFIDTHKLLDSLGLFHFLVGSSLLGMAREKRMIPGDKEVNFGVFGEDLTPQMLNKLADHFQVVVKPSPEKNGITYLFNHGYPVDKMWEHPVGFTTLQPMYQKGSHFYYSIFDSHCCTWPIKFARTMRRVKYFEEEFFAPYLYEEWLHTYYGWNWGVRDPDWSWVKDAKNYIKWEDLQEKIKQELL